MAWMDERLFLENSTACRKSMPFVGVSWCVLPFVGGVVLGAYDVVETNVMSVDVMHLIEAR
ncbi:hypothetical protein GCM10027404_15140 [Arthrobacter tumbae]